MQSLLAANINNELQSLNEKLAQAISKPIPLYAQSFDIMGKTLKFNLELNFK